MAKFVNPLAAALLATTLLYYVLIYTVWLKRRTSQNIVIGGASGALPPVIGWASVTGEVGAEALVLFLIIFLWTPPHSWALALYRRQDYARAKVPMLPVVAGERATRNQILLYTLLLIRPAFCGGSRHVWRRLRLGRPRPWRPLLRHALRVWRDETNRSAMPLFGYSIVYLFLIFAFLLTDSLLISSA